MRAKITKQRVDSIEPGPKPIIVFDTDLPGFVLKVTPTGHRVYQVRYRMGGRGTPLRTLTLGRHGSLTPELARRQAQQVIGQVRGGIDPAAEKARKIAEDRGGLTVADLSREFLAVYGETKLKPRSLIEYRRAFERHINPALGGLKVRAVTHGDVERLHHGMRTMPTGANRTVAALSKFFSWAIRGGYRPDRTNPCQGLEKFKEVPRKRYLSAPEIGRVGEAIRSLEAADQLTPHAAAFFRALLLTGLRRDELRRLEWRRVNLERAVIVLEETDSKTGARDVPLSAPVLQLLAGIPRIEGNPFVFCGHKRGQPIVNASKAWKRIVTAAGLRTARPYPRLAAHGGERGSGGRRQPSANWRRARPCEPANDTALRPPCRQSRKADL